MLRLSRTLTVALLAGVALTLLLGSWFRSGWQSSDKEAAARRKAPLQQAQAELGELAMELGSRLDSLRSKENARPYYHYQNLFHDPRGLSDGKSVGPSPLVDATGDPLITAHFQIDARGILTIPPINEELEQFSSKEAPAQNAERLLSLRAAQTSFVEASTLVAAQDVQQRQMPQIAELPVQQAVFEQQAYMQNVAPNGVFFELEGKKKASANDRGDTTGQESVEVSTHGFQWRGTEIDGRTELVALRHIETPRGNLRQGFVIDSAVIADWLQVRGQSNARVILRPESPHKEGELALAVPALPGWQLLTDTTRAQALADTQALAMRRDFLWRFVPASAVAFMLLLAVVLVVSRAERFANERSQFAASAAHELRTPLAGLQLYGDMLAEGLGDQNAKEKYARLISDEAQRLGRVVSNVLDFSQLEQKGVSLHPRKTNLAQSMREIYERLRRPLEHAGMQLEFLAPDSVVATYDEDALARIVQNLMDNAEKYTREHPDRRLQVVVDTAQSRARVSISDAGAGVTRDMRAHIFKPFGRHAGPDGPAGLGLGLALARALARQQGGDLLVEESTLGGARFVLHLPVS